MSAALAARDVPATLRALSEPVAAELREVEARLAGLFPAGTGGPAPVVYQEVLQAGGKRLRPSLTLLSCAAAGGDPTAAVATATGVEIVHLASLIHDDVIDDAHERRGRPTARGRWGNRTSILVGDLLIAEVFHLLSGESERAALELVVEAVVQMCQSELNDGGSGDDPVSEAHYFELIAGKTAALMSAACGVGAVMGGSAAAVEALRAYGHALGLAFQITDDLLDLYGDPDKLGKPVYQDLRGGHVTLPIIAALDRATADEARGLRELIAAGDAQAAQVANRVEALGGRAYAEERAATLAREAVARLTDLSPSPARNSLETLPEVLIGREV